MRRAIQVCPILCCASIALAVPAWAEDPGLRGLQLNQQMRQHQQDDLQLRMKQQQHRARNPPADSRQQQAIHRQEIEQGQRQQELHYRQSIVAQPAADLDDAGTRRAKSQIGEQRARQESEQQLRRFEWERRQEAALRAGEKPN